MGVCIVATAYYILAAGADPGIWLRGGVASMEHELVMGFAALRAEPPLGYSGRTAGQGKAFSLKLKACQFFGTQKRAKSVCFGGISQIFKVAHQSNSCISLMAGKT